VVGSPLNTYGPVVSAGAVYVLTPSSSGYVQSCIATPSPQASNKFGSSVAVFRSTLVVGAPDANSGEGTAYLYRLTPAGPVFRRQLQRPALAKAIGDKYATSVAVTDGTIVVGEPGMDTAAGADSGGAYVFADDGNTVVLDGTVEPLAGATSSAAGTSVAIEDEHIVLGAPLADSAGETDSGAAFVFERPPGGWLADTTESGTLTDSEGEPGDRLGTSVALTDDGAVVGIPLHDEPSTDAATRPDQGQVLIYDLLDVLMRDEFE